MESVNKWIIIFKDFRIHIVDKIHEFTGPKLVAHNISTEYYTNDTTLFDKGLKGFFEEVNTFNSFRITDRVRWLVRPQQNKTSSSVVFSVSSEIVKDYYLKNGLFVGVTAREWEG